MELLAVKNLTFGYEDDPVLNDFNMAIFENEILLVEGENGAGKTTLLKCLTNVVNNGQNVFIHNTEVFQDKTKLQLLSFIMSEDILYDYMTLKENIDFFKVLFNQGNEYLNNVKILCDEFNVTKYENHLIKNLSQGTRNKVYMAIMLAKKHDILILDEPFTALDKRTQKIMIDKIKSKTREKSKCVIMVTHVNEFKSIATRAIKINKLENYEESITWI